MRLRRNGNGKGRGPRVLAAVGLFLSVLGCNRTELSGKLVVIPHKVSGLLWLSEHVGIMEAAERRHLAVAWSGPNDDEYIDEQYEITDRAIREGAKGIILSPDVNWMFRREMLLARDRHIPVVLEGDSAGIQASPGISLAVGDMTETGRMVAERLGGQLGHRGEVLIVGLNAHTPGTQERSDAIVAALAAQEPGISVVGNVFDAGSPTHSEVLVYQALAAHPRIGAIISLSAGETVAAARAARVSGRLPQVRIVGCDQSPPLLMLLRLGVLDSLLVQDNRRQGELAVDTISDMRAGLYSSRTMYVRPVLVTRENIATEAVQQVLLMHR